MAATQISTRQIGSVQKNDIDITTLGQALITKVIAGTNMSISSTGGDAGTGDVTINSTAQSNLSILNVKDYGAVGDGTTNDTTAFQNCMNAVNAKGGGVMWIPKTTNGYAITKLLLKNSVSIWGEANVEIKAISSAETGLFVLDDSPIAYVTYKDFKLIGNAANTNQHGWNITSIPQSIPGYTGGMWYVKFENLEVQGFPKNQFHFYSYDIQPPASNSGDMANQFLTFIDVKAFKSSSNASSRCFYAEGQFGQMQFLGNCEFDGDSMDHDTWLVELVSRPESFSGTDNIYSVSFNGTTFQSSKKGLRTYASKGVVLRDCHWENVRQCVYADAVCDVTVENNVFAVCGYTVAADGYIVQNNNSYVKFLYNNLASTSDVHLNNVFNIGENLIDGNSVDGGTSALKTSGVTKQIGADGTLVTKMTRTFIVNTSATAITTIVSALGVGETITLRAWSGPITFSTGGNISLGELSSYTVPSNAAVQLINTDLPSQWLLLNANTKEIVRSVNSISTTTTAGSTASTDYVYLCTGTFNLTIPVSTTNRYTVKNIGSGVITILPSSGLIEGAASIGLSANNAVDLISNLTNLYII